MKVSSILLAVLPFLYTASAHAQGVPLQSGRITEGTMSIFTMSAAQRNLVDCVLKTGADHPDDTRTPYIFRLTPEQSRQLQEEAGQSPTRFRIYDADDAGNIGDGTHWNIIVRIDPSEIEIPHKYLLSDAKAEEVARQQGWAPNTALERLCGAPTEKTTQEKRAKK